MTMVYKPSINKERQTKMAKNILEAKIGFGTWQALDPKLIVDQLRWAIENNYDFIDTAWVYENEKIIGDALSTLRNQNYKIPPIQTKIWTPFFKQDVIQQLKSQLKDLQLECVDSVLLHRPHVDNTMNVKAWKELIECKKKGLVDVIGVSNFEPDMVRILYNETGVYPEVVQNEASLTYIRRDRMVFCKEHNIAMQGWRALGNPKVNFNNEYLKQLAAKYNCSVAQLLIAYSHNLGFCPIVRSAIESEIRENIKATSIKISDVDLLTLELKFNTHKSTTHNECDSYANLALDDDWYKNN